MVTRDSETTINKRAILIALLLFFFYVPGFLYAQDANNFYPTEERLFHIERSKNKNLVCYDVNLVDGKLDAKNPLNIYWVNREETPGETKPLNAMQKRLAYGYKVISRNEDSLEITLSAYSGKVLTVHKLGGKYVCTLDINNQQAILNSLYVKAKESNSLSVEYVELRGLNLDTKESISERVEK